MTDAVDRIIDAFYRQFLLRDILGKVFPGLIMLIAGALAVDPHVMRHLLRSAQEGGTWFWVVITTGLAWLAGVAAQGLGEAV